MSEGIWVDMDTIKKFLSGVYSAKYMRTWFQEKLDPVEPEEVRPAQLIIQPTSHKQRMMMMLEEHKKGELYLSNWERNFLVDNIQFDQFSERQIGTIDKLWHRFTTRGT